MYIFVAVYEYPFISSHQLDHHSDVHITREQKADSNNSIEICSEHLPECTVFAELLTACNGSCTCLFLWQIWM